MLSAPIFNLNADNNGRISILPEGIELFNGIDKQKLKIITWLSPGLHDGKNQIQIRLIPLSGYQLCIFDISSMWDSIGDSTDDSYENKAILFLLQISSLFVVVSPPDDPKLTLKRFSFIRGLIDDFSGDLDQFKASNVSLPEILFIFFSESPKQSSSKELLELFFKPENGFSTEIAMRNQLRDMIQEVVPNRSNILFPLSSADQFISDIYWAVVRPELMERLDEIPLDQFNGVAVTAELFSSYLSASIEGSTDYKNNTLSENREIVAQKYLESLVESLVQQYKKNMEEEATVMLVTSPGIITSSSSSSQDEMKGMLTVQHLKQAHVKYRDIALSHHSAVALIPSKIISASRKSLQNKVRQLLKEALQQCISDYQLRCENICHRLVSTELAQKGNINDETTVTETEIVVESGTSSVQTQKLVLGDGSAAYSQLLSFKNNLEKLVTTYNADTAPPPSVTLEFTEQKVRSQVLSNLLVSQIKKLLRYGVEWVQSFEALVQQTSEEISSLDAEKQRLEKKLVELEGAAEDGVTSAEQRLQSLQDSLSLARKMQTEVMEANHSKLEGLMDTLDRAARLNEQEKNELAQELMTMQHRILKAQEKGLEMRRQRESSTASLQRGLLSGERDGHLWFKEQIAKQHALLEEELRLERALATSQSDHTNEVFTQESKHLRYLEEARITLQRNMQRLREENFKSREDRAKAHEQMVAKKRSVLMDLESKLVLMTDAYNRHIEGKPCRVM